MWKLSHNLILPPLSNLFCNNEHAPGKFILPKASTEYSKRAITYSCVKFWNAELTESHRGITSLKLFNNKYKVHLLSSLANPE